MDYVGSGRMCNSNESERPAKEGAKCEHEWRNHRGVNACHPRGHGHPEKTAAIIVTNVFIVEQSIMETH